MKRTKKKPSPDLILTGDWHITEKQPLCRTDDFWTAQWDSIALIKGLSKRYGCPVVNSGDIFHHWKTSPFLINTCLENFPEDMRTIVGNHDLPQHNIQLLKKSAIYTLALSKSVELLDQGHFGRDLKEIPYWDFKGRKIIVLHKLVWAGEKPWPGCTEMRARDLFGIFPEADLILTGDNHKTFILKDEKKRLVNPGSLMAFTADQIDHQPCVFFWYAKSNRIQRHNLADSSVYIDRSHIKEKREKEEQIAHFINHLKKGWSLSLNFERNLDRVIIKNKINPKIKRIVLEWMGR